MRSSSSRKTKPRNGSRATEYFTFYQKLNNLKHNQKALAAGLEGGDLVSYATQSPDLYIFSREKDGSKVVVLTNLGKADTAIEFTGEKPEVTGMQNFFTGEEAAIPASLAPGQYLVFVNK